MAQVTIYLSDPVEKKVRQEARRARKSLSAYLAELATRRAPARREWPQGFAELFGSWEGDLRPPADAPPDELEGL